MELKQCMNACTCIFLKGFHMSQISFHLFKLMDHAGSLKRILELVLIRLILYDWARFRKLNSVLLTWSDIGYDHDRPWPRGHRQSRLNALTCRVSQPHLPTLSPAGGPLFQPVEVSHVGPGWLRSKAEWGQNPAALSGNRPPRRGRMRAGGRGWGTPPRVRNGSPAATAIVGSRCGRREHRVGPLGSCDNVSFPSWLYKRLLFFRRRKGR